MTKSNINKTKQLLNSNRRKKICTNLCAHEVLITAVFSRCCCSAIHNTPVYTHRKRVWTVSIISIKFVIFQYLLFRLARLLCHINIILFKIFVLFCFVLRVFFSISCNTVLLAPNTQTQSFAHFCQTIARHIHVNIKSLLRYYISFLRTGGEKNTNYPKQMNCIIMQTSTHLELIRNSSVQCTVEISLFVWFLSSAFFKRKFKVLSQWNECGVQKCPFKIVKISRKVEKKVA